MKAIEQAAGALTDVLGNVPALFRYTLSGFVSISALLMLDATIYTMINTKTDAIVAFVAGPIVVGFLLYAINTATYFPLLSHIEFTIAGLITGIKLEQLFEDALKKKSKARCRWDIDRWRRRVGSPEDKAVEHELANWNSVAHFLLCTGLGLLLVPILLLVYRLTGASEINRWAEDIVWDRFFTSLVIGVLLYALGLYHGARATCHELVLTRELRIRQRAYENYLGRKPNSGSALEDWIEAEKQIDPQKR